MAIFTNWTKMLKLRPYFLKSENKKFCFKLSKCLQYLPETVTAIQLCTMTHSKKSKMKIKNKLNFEYIYFLSLHIFFTHKNRAFQAKFCTNTCRCNTVLPCTSFGDNVFFSHFYCKQNLPNTIVNFGSDKGRYQKDTPDSNKIHINN